MERWYCGKYAKFMTNEELRLHHCFCRQKGRNKGRRCWQLNKQEYYHN